MLVIQHIWTRWTKQARSAAARRPQLKPAYRLPGPIPVPEPGKPQVVIHTVRHSGEEGAEQVETFENARDAMTGSLRWRPLGSGFALSLTRPLGPMLCTAWPDQLPSPLITLESGQSTVIDWNGRFHAAMSATKGYFYAQHRIAAACVDEARPDLFLTLEPRKTFDFTTRIY